MTWKKLRRFSKSLMQMEEKKLIHHGEKQDLAIVVCLFTIIIATLRLMLYPNDYMPGNYRFAVMVGSLIPCALLYIIGCYLRSVALLIPFSCQNVLGSIFLFIRIFVAAHYNHDHSDVCADQQMTLLGLYGIGQVSNFLLHLIMMKTVLWHQLKYVMTTSNPVLARYIKEHAQMLELRHFHARNDTPTPAPADPPTNSNANNA